MRKKRDIRGHLVTAIESLSVNLILLILPIRSLESRDRFLFPFEGIAFGLTLISLIGVVISWYEFQKQNGKEVKAPGSPEKEVKYREEAYSEMEEIQFDGTTTG